MEPIQGEAKTIRQLMSSMKYSIDYYQREYKWTPKQVKELVDDLIESFQERYNENDERKKVQNYSHYFLGSVIMSTKNNQTYIIDGQQRLSTLTLLLIYLKNRQGDREDKVNLDDLILSVKHGEKSFNIQVEERKKCLEALLKGETNIDFSNASESVKNLYDRYIDIENSFSEEIEEVDDKAIPYFADWLIENVHLVQIKTSSDKDAYRIFETMNDRGLRLTPLDMLKGYLLNNIDSERDRIDAGKIWTKQIRELMDWESDSDAIKAWLRSQYAMTTRERKKGAVPKDFDIIGTEFHRWVRDNAERIGINNSSDFYDFITEDLHFFTERYLELKKYSKSLTEGYEAVYFIDRFGFTLQFPLILAPLTKKDIKEIIDQKIRIVSTFIEILLARRIWNRSSINYNVLQYFLFNIMLAIRGKKPIELVKILTKKLDEMDEDFSTYTFELNKQNRKNVRLILARITDYVEQSSKMTSRLAEYLEEGDKRYEIEHIWADRYDRFKKEFNSKYEFEEYRNHLGGLLLLPKNFNAAYGDSTYESKLKHYITQNLLARSLNPDCYRRNPGFLSFIKNSELGFKPYTEFWKDQLDERQELYTQLAMLIWSPERLQEELDS